MNETEHRELRDMLGALLLGGLTLDEKTRVRAHLETCADCQDEHDLVEPVARELALLRPATTGAAESAPADLGDRIAGAVAAERGARRRSLGVRMGLVALGSAAVAATIAVLVVGALEPDPVPLEPVAVTVEESGVVAGADLVNHTWGVEIKLTASGLQPGATYRVAVVIDGGGMRPAGEFIGTGSAQMRCNLNSSVLRPHAVGFVVVDEFGSEVITSTFDS